MNRNYEYRQRRKYPHLLPSDARIWHAFIETHPDLFDYVIYDIHIGNGVQPNPSWNEKTKEMAKTLTQRRIDVIGFKNNQLWLIELKAGPGVSALGQLVAYEHLYKRQYPNTKPILYLICDRLDDDLRYCLQQQQIKYTVVPITNALTNPSDYNLPKKLQ